MHAVLIENPTAHNVTPARLRVAERALAATFDLELVSTRSRWHAYDLAQDAVASGAKTVIAYGGDGTANEVVNGLRSAAPEGGVVFAHLPGGGTNVLARSLGYPNDLVDATAHLIDLVEAGSHRPVCLGRLRGTGPGIEIDRYFTFGAGVGLDGETVRLVEATGLRPRWGDLAFVYCTMRAFRALRKGGEPGLVLETPEGPVEAWWASIGNTDPFTYLGKRPFRVTPSASIDGRLDLAAGLSASYLRTLRWIGQALTKPRHVDHPKLLHLSDLEGFEFHTKRPLPLQADGEFLGHVTRLSAASVPAALSIWA